MAEVPTLISDFSGADENPLSEGGNWADVSSTSTTHLKIVSNQVGATATGNAGAYWTPTNFGPDCEVYATIATFGTNTGVLARIQQEGGAATWDGYAVVVPGSTSISILSITDGATSNLGSIAVTISAGDKVGISCRGSTIESWLFHGGVWAKCVGITDATFPNAGKIGLIVNNTTGRVDEIYAGNGTGLFGRAQQVPAVPFP